MESNKYVNSHDFGYGKIPEQRFLNKLKLRNINDTKEYICGVIENAFDCEIDNFMVKFSIDKYFIKIVIKEV